MKRLTDEEFVKLLARAAMAAPHMFGFEGPRVVALAVMGDVALTTPRDAQPVHTNVNAFQVLAEMPEETYTQIALKRAFVDRLAGALMQSDVMSADTRSAMSELERLTFKARDVGDREIQAWLAENDGGTNGQPDSAKVG